MDKYDIIVVVIQGVFIFPGLFFLPLWVIILPVILWLIINLILVIKILYFIDKK
jgi:hypothetical protein